MKEKIIKEISTLILKAEESEKETVLIGEKDFDLKIALTMLIWCAVSLFSSLFGNKVFYCTAKCSLPIIVMIVFFMIKVYNDQHTKEIRTNGNDLYLKFMEEIISLEKIDNFSTDSDSSSFWIKIQYPNVLIGNLRFVKEKKFSFSNFYLREECPEIEEEAFYYFSSNKICDVIFGNDCLTGILNYKRVDTHIRHYFGEENFQLFKDLLFQRDLVSIKFGNTEQLLNKSNISEIKELIEC